LDTRFCGDFINAIGKHLPMNKKDERYSIDTLFREIQSLSKKEKIEYINGKLRFYSEWKYKDGTDYTAAMFGYGFYDEAEALLKQIEADNSHMYDRDLNWYFNADNIPNQKAVFATSDFIEKEKADLFTPTDFFNLLFKQKDELTGYLEKPFDFIKNLKTLPLNEEQLYLLLGMILYWFGGYPVSNLDGKHDTILKLVEREFLSMFPDVPKPEKEFCANDNSKQDWMKQIEGKLNDNKAEYNFPESQYLRKINIDFEDLPHYVIQKAIIWRFEKQHFYKEAEYSTWKGDWAKFLQTVPEKYIVKAIEKGIEFAQKVYEYHLEKECSNKGKCSYNESWERRIAIAEPLLNEIKRANEPQEDKPDTMPEEVNNAEFTTARQVLAVHYLLEYCQVKNVDKTVKARFIQFLTGRETGTKRIQDTTIYKKVSNPFSLDNSTLNADLQFIRKYFEDLGLNEIAKMITNEISKSQS